MDYHALNRKELQALCKKNNIPANMKNAEMANRLASVSSEIMFFHKMSRKYLQSMSKQHGIPANLKNAELARRLESLSKVNIGSCKEPIIIEEEKEDEAGGANVEARSVSSKNSKTVYQECVKDKQPEGTIADLSLSCGTKGEESVRIIEKIVVGSTQELDSEVEHADELEKYRVLTALVEEESVPVQQAAANTFASTVKIHFNKDDEKGSLEKDLQFANSFDEISEVGYMSGSSYGLCENLTPTEACCALDVEPRSSSKKVKTQEMTLDSPSVSETKTTKLVMISVNELDSTPKISGDILRELISEHMEAEPEEKQEKDILMAATKKDKEDISSTIIPDEDIKLPEAEGIMENSAECLNVIHSSKDDEEGSVKKETPVPNLHGNYSADNGSEIEQAEISKACCISAGHYVNRETVDEVKDYGVERRISGNALKLSGWLSTDFASPSPKEETVSECLEEEEVKAARNSLDDLALQAKDNDICERVGEVSSHLGVAEMVSEESGSSADIQNHLNDPLQEMALKEIAADEDVIMRESTASHEYKEYPSNSLVSEKTIRSKLPNDTSSKLQDKPSSPLDGLSQASVSKQNGVAAVKLSLSKTKPTTEQVKIKREECLTVISSKEGNDKEDKVESEETMERLFYQTSLYNRFYVLGLLDD